jgi:hypothetical protein
MASWQQGIHQDAGRLANAGKCNSRPPSGPPLGRTPTPGLTITSFPSVGLVATMRTPGPTHMQATTPAPDAKDLLVTIRLQTWTVQDVWTNPADLQASPGNSPLEWGLLSVSVLDPSLETPLFWVPNVRVGEGRPEPGPTRGAVVESLSLDRSQAVRNVPKRVQEGLCASSPASASRLRHVMDSAVAPGDPRGRGGFALMARVTFVPLSVSVLTAGGVTGPRPGTGRTPHRRATRLTTSNPRPLPARPLAMSRSAPTIHDTSRTSGHDGDG